jgi:hypothetical protein
MSFINIALPIKKITFRAISSQPPHVFKPDGYDLAVDFLYVEQVAVMQGIKMLVYLSIQIDSKREGRVIRTVPSGGDLGKIVFQRGRCMRQKHLRFNRRKLGNLVAFYVIFNHPLLNTFILDNTRSFILVIGCSTTDSSMVAGLRGTATGRSSSSDISRFRSACWETSSTIFW